MAHNAPLGVCLSIRSLSAVGSWVVKEEKHTQKWQAQINFNWCHLCKNEQLALWAWCIRGKKTQRTFTPLCLDVFPISFSSSSSHCSSRSRISSSYTEMSYLNDAYSKRRWRCLKGQTMCSSSGCLHYHVFIYISLDWCTQLANYHYILQ